MKKLFCVIIAMAMIISLTACAKEDVPTVDAAESPIAEQVVTEDAVVAEIPAASEDGEPEIMIPAADAAELPPAQPDPNNQFGVDANINVETIDEWLGLDFVAYRDVRMMIDPGCYEAICGDSVLSGIVDGFEVVPYPYLATLTGLPPEVAKTQYDGDKLFDLEFDESGAITSVKANFVESETIINDLFPKGQPIFLMCGGGGYASFTKNLLIQLGYDETMIYNVGGYWQYAAEGPGANTVEIKTTVDGVEYNAFHRLDYHYIDFSQLHPVD